MVIAKSKLDSKRERALQFAKQVPKPTVISKGDPAVNRNHKHSKQTTGGVVGTGGTRAAYGDDYDGDDGGMGDYGGDENMQDCFDDLYANDYATAQQQTKHLSEPSRLEQLQAKHAQSKKQADAIKASLGMK